MESKLKIVQKNLSKYKKPQNYYLMQKRRLSEQKLKNGGFLYEIGPKIEELKTIDKQIEISKKDRDKKLSEINQQKESIKKIIANKSKLRKQELLK